MNYFIYILLIFFLVLKHVNSSIINNVVDSSPNYRKQIKNHIKKRSIYDIKQVKWEMPIRYFVGTSHEYVEYAVKNIQANTCIKFEKQSSMITSGYGINFISENFCGFDFYGRNPVPNKPQYINISYDCDGVIGIQELIHNTLLVKNEHTRSDRDKYINVTATLASYSEMYRFNKDNVSDTTFFGMAYDYGSMTHFSSTQYGEHDKEVIKATKYHEHYKRTMGQKLMATFNDYKLLNYYYCNHTCTVKKTDCEYDGYQDPHDCSKCRCPSGFVGNKCERLAPSYGYCGPWTYDAKSFPQTMGIWGLSNCYFRIISQNFNKIKLIIKELFIHGYDHYSYDKCIEGKGLDIKYRESKGPMGICFCVSPYHVPIVIDSESHVVVIHYVGTYELHKVIIEYQEIL